MTLDLIFIAAAGYLIGTIPSAYIIRRLSSGKDITDEGSGNVGARNLYEVTGSKWLGISALVLDALKGVVAVWIATIMYGDLFAAKAFIGMGVIVGHNFNVFLKGKGGRGLATALGLGLMMNPLMVFTWFVMYLIGYFVLKRDVAVGSMAGTIGVAVFAYSLPDLAIDVSTIVPYQELSEVRLFMAVLMIPIFIRFLGPVREIMKAAAMAEEEEDGGQ